MPQTLLALLALSLAALLSFNQQRVTTRSYETMISQELELAASGAMMHAMEFIAARSFDENSTPGGIDANQRLPEAPGHLSNENRFGVWDRGFAGCDLMRPHRTPRCDDVDDLDGLQNVPVWITLASGDSLQFEVDVDVTYVADADIQTPSESPTFHKRVVLQARSPLLDHLPGNLIEIERVVSYDPLRADAQYENDRGHALDY
jgi:hypothetical protein